MCDPVTMTVLAVASTGVGLYAQHESAKAQSQMIQSQAANEKEEALDAAEEEMGQRVRAARERRARARVAAGESGAMGASFAAQINQSLSDQNADNALVAKNARQQQEAINDRVNVAESQIKRVSALEAGLQLTSAGISGYAKGQNMAALKAPKTPRGPKPIPGAPI